MSTRRALIGLGIVLLLAISSATYPLSASELSDAEARLIELRTLNESKLEAVNGWLPKSLADSQNCIDQLKGATSPDDIAARQTCQDTLARSQAYSDLLKSEIEAIKVEMDQLTLQINKLKTPNSSGSGPSVGSTTTSIGVPPIATPQGTTTPQSTSSPVAGASAQPIPTTTPIAMSPEPTSSPTKVAANTSASSSPTPASSTTPIGTPKPVSSSSPKVAQKITPSPLPQVKKKTITCVKGKTVRKVTAVKPVCPKGFKVQKSK